MSQLFRVPFYDNDGDSVAGCTPTVYYSHPDPDDLSGIDWTVCSSNGGVATERLLPSGAGSGQYYIVLTDEEWNDGVVDFYAVPTAEDKSVRNAKETPTYYDDTKINALQTDVSTINTNITTILDLVESGAVANVTASSGSGLTLVEMVDLVRLMVNEVNQAGHEPFEFTLPKCLLALNAEQKTVVRDLYPGICYSLETSDSAVALTSGAIALTDLTHTPLDGRLGIQRLVHSAQSLPVKLLSEWEVRMLEAQYGPNLDSWYSEYSPVMWWWGASLYVRPYSGYTATVYYRREPVEMAMNYTGESAETPLLVDGNTPLLVGPTATPPSNIDCELPYGAQLAVVERAVARLFRAGRDPERGAVHDAVARDIIARLNREYRPTDTPLFGAPYNLSLDPYQQSGGTFNIYTGMTSL
jgi:hypothetical protein